MKTARNPITSRRLLTRGTPTFIRKRLRYEHGMSLPAALIDVDGTLVDTNYHHSIAWYRAFRRHGVVLPLWQIHRHMGMGGDHLVPKLAGEQLEKERGDDIRAAEKDEYGALIDGGGAASGRPRPVARAALPRPPDGAGQLGEGGGGGPLPGPARRARPGGRLDNLGRRREDQARAGPGAVRSGDREAAGGDRRR